MSSISVLRRLERLAATKKRSKDKGLAERLRDARARYAAEQQQPCPPSEEKIVALENSKHPLSRRIARAYRRMSMQDGGARISATDNYSHGMPTPETECHAKADHD